MADFPPRRRAGLLAALIVVAGALGACSGAAGSTTAPGAAPMDTATSAPVSGTSGAAAPSGAPGDWVTYHRDNGRTGVAPSFPAVTGLSRAWQANLDGAVYGQPLVVGDRILAATENDTVVALDRAHGTVLWQAHVGTPVPRSALPCGNIDPLGITSTMAYDPATGLVFALAESTGGVHTLVGVDVATGAVKLRREAEPPKGDKLAHQQRSALTVWNDRVYIAYGGLAGDCANYIGSVIAVPTSGNGAILSYAVPTPREAGIWTPGGGTVVGDRIYYAVGNGESTSSYDGSDSVLALTADLARTDFFAPKSWVDDNARDLDLGSMTPAAVGQYIFADGKRAQAYVLHANHLGGLGGQLSEAGVCKAFGGAAVSGMTVYVPCSDGPRSVTLSASGAMSVGWHGPSAAKGSPVLGGGGVWVVDYDGGVLYVLDPANGSVRYQLAIGKAPHFTSPTLGGTQAYIGTMTGVVAVAPAAA